MAALASDRSGGAPAGGAGLDERLVDVALDLLAREGVEALTLRRIAKEAGVSHGAPLRHYRGLSALLAQVAVRGYRLLQDAVGTAASSLPDGSPARARLQAAGRAYVDAAVANPALFALMFSPDRLDWDVPLLLTESAAAFEQLVDLVHDAQAEGWHAGADTRVLAGAKWATVHGLATLWAQGVMQLTTRNDSLEVAVEMTIAIESGSADAMPSGDPAPGSRSTKRRAGGE